MSKLSIHDLSYEHQQAIEAMKSQLLIVLIDRAGGEAFISTGEIDATGKYNLAMRVDPEAGGFYFKVHEKGQQP